MLMLCLLLMTSCGTFRVGEEKIPDPVRKTKQHKETERVGAYYLFENTTNENQLVASALSRSLGTPNKKQKDPNVLESELFRHIANFENENVQLNDKLEEYNGMSIAGTGYNLFPFFSGFGIVAIVALLILFPSATTILFFVLRRTRTAFANVVEGIQEFSKDDPEHSKHLDELLEKKLDRREKLQLKKF
jgi:hypothetical protein